MSDFLRRFATEFAALDAGNLARLGELYSDDVLFRDPLHEVRGLPALQRYFAEMYANVGRLDFDFHGFDQVAEGEGYLRWKMSFCHPRLAKGEVTPPDPAVVEEHVRSLTARRDTIATMHFRHPRLRGGAPISVDGCSHLLWRDKVYQHRDYFDAGAMLYEHLPLMGGVIAWLKRRLA